MRDFVLLTLRIGKAVEARTRDDWMLDYFGPPEWKALVDAEEPQPGGALLDARGGGDASTPRFRHPPNEILVQAPASPEHGCPPARR